MKEEEQHPINRAFTVTSISREDLMHPVIGLTLHEARLVTDEQMMEIARKLGNNSANQIPKSSLKWIANTILKK